MNAPMSTKRFIRVLHTLRVKEKTSNKDKEGVYGKKLMTKWKMSSPQFFIYKII